MSDAAAIAVIGAGLMSHGIAYVMAAAGHRVRVFDRSEDALAACLYKGWSFRTTEPNLMAWKSSQSCMTLWTPIRDT